MAIVNLGTRNLIIGDAPSVFDPFPFIRTEAYLFAATFTIANPANIFSDVTIKVFIDIPGLPDFLGAETVKLDIVSVLSTFYYPFSPLYQGDGQAFIIAERKSFIRGTAEADSDVSLNLIYDDAITVPTWRG